MSRGMIGRLTTEESQSAINGFRGDKIQDSKSSRRVTKPSAKSGKTVTIIGADALRDLC